MKFTKFDELRIHDNAKVRDKYILTSMI